jgi:hypothetical protein
MKKILIVLCILAALLIVLFPVPCSQEPNETEAATAEETEDVNEEEMSPTTLVKFFLIFALMVVVGQCMYNDEQDEQDEYFDGEGIDTEAVGARVISKDFENKVNGTKYVRHSSSFFVTFLTDDGEEKEFKVTRELFDRLYEDQTGTLVTVNGNFFDFGDGEELTE